MLYACRATSATWFSKEVLDGRATLLPKPFTLQGLLTQINEVLRAKPNE